MAKKNARPRRKKLDTSLPIYQLKISLDRIDPPIWRRVQTDDCTLAELHQIIQAAMGWRDDHPHVFEVAGQELGDPRIGSHAEFDSRTAWLSMFAKDRDTVFSYVYDFGDEWKHTIEIEETLPPADGAVYPRCVAGERACPPEDCGGPYEYPFFCEAIQDPEHDEYEEMRAWVDEDFDPEVCDLDRANRELLELRRWLGRRKGRRVLQAAFAKGDLVKAKPGLVHELYPDLPLGGWVGRVRRVGWLTPIGYAVHWTDETLAKAHPLFFKRAHRDGEDPRRHWFNEGQLEPADAETPSAMEQPTNLVARPLSEEEATDRIRMVFGLTSDDRLPDPDEPSQQQYLDHLRAHLKFPFRTAYFSDDYQAGEVDVLGFAEPPLGEDGCLACQARTNRNRVLSIPLADLDTDSDDPSLQFVEDYQCWLYETQDSDF